MRRFTSNAFQSNLLVFLVFNYLASAEVTEDLIQKVCKLKGLTAATVINTDDDTKLFLTNGQKFWLLTSEEHPLESNSHQYPSWIGGNVINNAFHRDLSQCTDELTGHYVVVTFYDARKRIHFYSMLDTKTLTWSEEQTSSRDSAINLAVIHVNQFVPKDLIVSAHPAEREMIVSFHENRIESLLSQEYINCPLLSNATLIKNIDEKIDTRSIVAGFMHQEGNKINLYIINESNSSHITYSLYDIIVSKMTDPTPKFKLIKDGINCIDSTNTLTGCAVMFILVAIVIIIILVIGGFVFFNKKQSKKRSYSPDNQEKASTQVESKKPEEEGIIHVKSIPLSSLRSGTIV